MSRIMPRELHGEQPTLSAIIPTHRRVGMLVDLVTRLREDPGIDEIVVAVDGADPDTESALAALAALAQGSRGDVLRWLVLEPSVGTARAKLAAAGVARGEVLLLLDDDVLPARSVGAGHARHHADGAGLVVLGAMPVAVEASSPASVRLYDLHYRAAVEKYRQDPDSVLGELWGGHVSVRRSDYLALREEILRYPRVAHEDRHFGLVAQAAGLRGRYDDSLVVHHRVTRGWHGLLRESLRQGQGDGALHALHPQLGPVDVDEPLEGANPLVKAIVRRTDRDGPRRAVLGSLHGLTTAADRLRLTRTAERAAFAATLVARRQGASGRAGAPPHPQGAGAHGPAGGDG